MRNNNKFKRFICCLLAIVLLVGYIPTGAVAAQESGNSDNFTPMVRFAVTSDTHVRPSSDPLNGYDQLAAFMDSVYAYSEAQPYNKLDGIFFVGDNSNRGAQSEQTYFFNYVKEHTKEGTVVRAVLGNHEFYANGYDYDGDAGPAEFMKYSGYDAVDFHLELNGYHIIMMSMNKYASYSYFSDTKLAWLKTEIEKAIAADPDKPIFVMQHQAPYETMKGSTGTGSDKKLRTLLDNYPQVINFSGHTHVSLSDPRSIWQGTFTALNTGSLAYLNLPIMGVTNSGKGLDAEGGWNTAASNQGDRNGRLYYMVEIDANDAVRILTCDMYTNTVVCEPYIIDSLNPADFKYTADRVNSADKPVFDSGDSLQIVTNNYKNAQISIPQATSKDTVQSYRVEVYKDGALEQTIYRSSCANFGGNMPDSINAYIANLDPETSYVVKVYACNSWNVDSEPLVTTLTTCAKNGGVRADVLDVTFRADGTAVNAVTGQILETHGAPTVTYNEDLEQYVASFDGVDDAYAWWGIGNWYDVIGESFTVETFVYFNSKPAKAMGILSNLQSAGMGLQFKTDGYAAFYTKAGEADYVSPNGPVAVGNWAHLVGTYDGTSVRFYINGQQVAKADASGKLAAPDYMARVMGIGADSAVNGLESYFNGTIATAKIYSDALTKTQVEALFSAGKITFCKHCQQSTTSYIDVDKTLAETWADGEAITSGHYVLQTNVDVTAALTVAKGEIVCIDLNGHTISAKAACRTFNNAGTLFLMNGNIVGSGAAGFDNIVDGANIYNSNVLTLDAVNVSGGKATSESYSATTIGTSGKYGGNIYNTGAGNVTINDSTVSGGIAYRGGNLYTVGTITVNDSLITGGHANRGGNIGVSSGTVYLNDSQVADGLGSWDGRNIFCTNRTAYVYMNGSTISGNGKNCSVRLQYGNLVMYSGSIDSGTGDALTISGTTGTPLSTVVIYDGNVTGTVKLAYGANLQVYGGMFSGKLSSDNTLTADASIKFYNGKTSFDPTAYLTDCACVQATDTGYMIWNYAHKEGACTETCPYEIALAETKITQENGSHSYVSGSDSWVCSGCGTTKEQKETTACSHGCTVTEWIPWDGTTVVDGGHYYLTGDLTLANQVQITNGIKVCIDLNGYIITAPRAMRAFRLTSAGTELNLMDSSEAKSGTVKGSGYVMEPSESDTNAHGGLIYVHTAHLNLYDVTVTGGMTTGERGGNIYCASGIVTLNNAKVTNGQNIDGIAARGGNICIFNPGAQLIIRGSESKVTGGIATRESKAYGGNIYCGNGATVIIYDGEISGGYADSDGANIEMMNGKDSDGRKGYNYIYGGTIGTAHADTPEGVQSFVVYGSTSYMNDLFIYGGHIDSIYDNGAYNIIQIYAGTFGFDPRTMNDDKTSALAECACVELIGDIYTVSHTNGTSTCGICSDNDYSQSHTYTLVGSHNYSEDVLACCVCGYVRATLEITTVNLRADAVGIYFSGNISYNKADTSILACGIAVSTTNPLPVADNSDPSSLYTTSGTSVLISGIMKEENDYSVNISNANQMIYCRAYVQLADGTYLYSDTVATCLKDVVETIDHKLWDKLSASQKTALFSMYTTFSEVMENWNITNIKNT